jgi:hypothetical protein
MAARVVRLEFGGKVQEAETLLSSCSSSGSCSRTEGTVLKNASRPRASWARLGPAMRRRGRVLPDTALSGRVVPDGGLWRSLVSLPQKPA